MVRINTTTWVTPTSYGLVFSHITSDHQLKRVFLDAEASESLFDGSTAVIDKLCSKGIALSNWQHHINGSRREKKQCDTLVKTHGWNIFSLYPLQYSVQTINCCNARCDFCYANAPSEIKKKNLSLTSIHHLKDYAADHGVKFGVSGGEPLLHPDIYDILAYRNNEVFDTLITNLTADVNLQRLVRTQVDLIQVSIHGYQQGHDRILRKKNAYEKIFDRMNQLMPDVHLATNTVITPENLEQIPLLLEDLCRLQDQFDKALSYVRFVPVVPSGTGVDTYTVQEGFINQVTSFLRKAQSDFSSMNFEIPLIHANPYEYYFQDDVWVCPAGSTVTVIRVDGRLVPCNQFLDTSVSSAHSIHEMDLQRIWVHDPLFSEMRKGIQTEKKMSCGECRYLIMKSDQIQ